MLPLEWVIGKISPKAKDMSSLAIVKCGFKIILFISGVHTTVIGYDNIPKDEPVLFIGNHNSFYDIIISYTYMKNRTGFVAKKEMTKVLFIRRWMKNLYCLFLDRDNVREGLKTVLLGIDYIKQGISIVIFPEGTRNKTGEGLLPFHAGSFKFSEKTQCKIIPMVQNNTAEIFENHLPWIKRTHTILEFGAPIDPKTLSPEDRKHISKYTERIISQMYENNKSLI
jgi:1-acyl-sn-glycerol-3-phosphate acyltransferase